MIVLHRKEEAYTAFFFCLFANKTLPIMRTENLYFKGGIEYDNIIDFNTMYGGGDSYRTYSHWTISIITGSVDPKRSANIGYFGIAVLV